MITAGEKIKALRKELKMTQTELAGEELTKSMLSQIENNQSNPSLKTLKYLADRLNRPVTYFLEDSSDRDMSFISGEAATISLAAQVVRIDELIEKDCLIEAEKEINVILSEKISSNTGKPFADILFKLGAALSGKKKQAEAQKYLKESIDYYSKGEFLLEAAKAYIELAKTFYQNLDYTECLVISEKAFELYHKSINKDSLFEIELYYYKLIILFAVGDLKQAAVAIKAALGLSEETSVYYKTGEIYRLDAIFYYLTHNSDGYEHSIEMALQFATVTNDNPCLARIYAMKGIVAVQNNQAEEALLFADKNKYYYGKEIYIFHLIRARAYFLMEKYEQACEEILKVDYPVYETHKFDYLNMWSSKVYEGLILNKLGKNLEAVEAVRKGIEKMSVVGDSWFLIFANKSMSEIYSSMEDYQNAFMYLKAADEIQDRIKNDENIIF